MVEIEINGETFVRKSDVDAAIKSAAEVPAKDRDGMQYCMVRTYSAGVFAGYVQSRDGKEVVMRDARRIWHWSGAASLSQLAMEGTKDPEACRFPREVDTVILTEAIEIIPMTERAKENIKAVPVWEK